MSILVCKDLTVDISGEELFSQVSFAIEEKEKVGLVGPNGAGKTTLIRAILGDWPLESGQIHMNTTIGYLPQVAELEDRGTVFSSMLEERSDILEMREQLHMLEAKMAHETEEKVLNQYVLLTETYEREGGYALEAQIRKILAGLGLEAETDTPVGNLSGGQKTRLALSKLLLRAPALLILDEPTNHLDITALEWLENFLKDYSGAVLTVSHDRYFLDRIVTKVLCLEAGSLKSYSGNFSEYELQRANEEKTLAREAERMSKKIARLEEYIRRNKAGVNSKQARGRESQLKKIKPVQALTSNNKNLGISLQTSMRSGDRVLEVEGLSLAYGSKVLFKNVDLDLRRGDRVALLGKNGIGKTSFLKAIVNRIPYQGKIRQGANVKIAYYSQEHEDLDLSSTVIDEIRDASGWKDPEIRTLLARYGFRGEDVFKPVRVLSGGEKSRLSLCKLFLIHGNLLLLDEPTNHLDTETRDVLEEALQDYDGTVLVVSHDRYFLDKVIQKIAQLTPDQLLIYDGDYTAYKANKAQEQETTAAPRMNNQTARQAEMTDVKMEKRRQKRLQQMEEEISALESNLRELEQEMQAVEANYERALELHREYEETKQRLDKALEEWIEISGD